MVRDAFANRRTLPRHKRYLFISSQSVQSSSFIHIIQGETLFFVFLTKSSHIELQCLIEIASLVCFIPYSHKDTGQREGENNKGDKQDTDIEREKTKSEHGMTGDSNLLKNNREVARKGGGGVNLACYWMEIESPMKS